VHAERVDITTKKIVTYLETVNPDVVIHCAAFTNVDQCESEREKAWAVNVSGTEKISTTCQKIGAKLVYISTDFVFDGKKGMYTEKDECNPLNWYGKTKLEGEKRVEQLDDYVIARTSVLYGWHTTLNFVTWVIHQLQHKCPIKIVTDQYTCPTLADNLAACLLQLSVKGHGLYHVAGSERINRYAFALKIAHTFGLDVNFITPIVSEELNQKAHRPKDSSLSIKKVTTVIDTVLLNIDEGLQTMKKEKEENV
jgi:dTDP-4-dehydrorhamnose reductase